MDVEQTNALVTRTGFRFSLRPVTAADEAVLADFFRHVTPEDLRFRFLTSVGAVSHDRLVAMVASADDRIDSFVAVNDRNEVIAAAMLAGDAGRERGEVAITIRSDHKGRGIGWTMLDYLVGRARERGYASIESLEDRQNRAAITLEQEMGFTAEPVAGEATSVLVRRALR